MPKQILIIGAGFSGAVLARQLADNLDINIIVCDARDHIGGNCHTERDGQTNVMVHKYGPHIFNTNHEDVWKYLNQFGTINPYVNRVKAFTARGEFTMPISLLTLNQFFNKRLNPAEAKRFLEELGDSSIKEPQNFEEQALKLIGVDLYKNFFYGYTKKQWGCEPSELPASILKRLPIRFNYEDNYYSSKYQGIPVEGYTKIIENILAADNITVKLSTVMETCDFSEFDHIFTTGSIDEFFNFSEGRLRYRTVTFERIEGDEDIQGTAVINYTEENVPFTRIHEHKYFTPWETHRKSVAFREYSIPTTPNQTPFYPLRLPEDLLLYERYKTMAKSNQKTSFLGRLGTYRYLDMDQVIGEALDFSRIATDALLSGKTIPVFGPQRSK